MWSNVCVLMGMCVCVCIWVVFMLLVLMSDLLIQWPAAVGTKHPAGSCETEGGRQDAKAASPDSAPLACVQCPWRV